MRDYAAARLRVAALDTRIAENSARLDAALTRQDRLQRRLNARADGMYRRGPFQFIEVLTASTSFDQFSNLWDALTRINLRDAQAIGQLKRTRIQIARTTATLLRQQEAASAQIRRVEAAKAKAQRELGQDRAAYRAYLTRIAAAAASTQPASASRAPAPRATPARTHRVPTRPVGAGEWKTAVASCYGMGAVGARTASGRTINADSMIVAHKTLPFGTLVEFSYQGHRAVASVEDRGPYTPGRSFDLGPGIARILGISGVETVRWRVVKR